MWSSVDNLWTSLASLWTAVTDHANGAPLAIPIFGGDLSRISQVLPAQDSVRLIALSFMFACRRQPVCERLDIVVQGRDAANLDMARVPPGPRVPKDSGARRRTTSGVGAPGR